MELISFENGRLINAYSIPVGSLRFYRKYVKELISTKWERGELGGCVFRGMEELAGIRKWGIEKAACGVGGLIRSEVRLRNRRHHSPVQIFSKSQG